MADKPITDADRTPEIMHVARILQKCGYMDRQAPNRFVPFYNYGITQKDVAIKMLEQNGMCDDCGRDLEFVKRWCIDHNHETGKVRGLICQSCNTAVRSIAKMRGHIAYMRKHGEEI